MDRRQQKLELVKRLHAAERGTRRCERQLEEAYDADDGKLFMQRRLEWEGAVQVQMQVVQAMARLQD